MAWKKKRLGDVCEIINDKPEKFSGEKKYYTTKAINNSRNYNPILVDFKNRPGRANLAPQIGDTGFATMKNTNKVFLIDSELVKGIFSTGFCILRPNSQMCPEFLSIYIESDIFQDIKNGLSGKGIMGGIKKSDIPNIQILVPLLEEQKQIVKILDDTLESIFKSKEAAEKNLENAKELFESYLEGMFSNPGEDWEEKKLGEVCEFKNGLNFNRSSTGDSLKMVGVGDFQDNFYVNLGTLNKIRIDGVLNKEDQLKNDDILTVRSNGSPDLVGRFIMLKDVDEIVSYSGFTIRIRINNHNNIFPEYLCNYLKFNKTRKELIENSNGVSIKSLNQKMLSSLKLILPSLQKQKQIVSKLDALSKEIKELETVYEQKILNLDELKKSILQKAFSGELTK